MSKPIRPGYVIFNHKRSFFFFAKKKENVIKSESIANIYIVYKLSSKSKSSSNVFKNSLFGAIKITKPNNTTDPEKIVYSGYGISFDRTGQFTHSDGTQARNVIILGVDLSTSNHNTNKKRNILVLGHGLIQKINSTTIYVEKMYSPNFRAENKAFCLYYNGDDSCLLMANKPLNLKPKILKLNQTN